LYIDVDMTQLHDLISRLGLQAEIGIANAKGLPRGIGPAVMDEEMADATTRLVKCLQSEAESQILGPGLVREILYRALCGAQAEVLYSLAMHGGAFAQVARALRHLEVLEPWIRARIKTVESKFHEQVSHFH
jgi:hypothetical protein